MSVKQVFFHRIIHSTTIKDFIESPGWSHTEEDLILVNGNPVN
ncbi:hypothetical protein [Legionella maceachernii]